MILRQFTDNSNGSLYEMLFETQEDADAYVPPDDRTEVVPPVPRPSPEHRWIDGAWAVPEAE